MAKTNYNRIEDAIDKGLQGLKVAALLKQADAVQAKTNSDEQQPHKYTPKQLMTLIDQDLKRMYKEDHSIYKTLKLKRKKVDALIALVNQTTKLPTEEEIQEITQLRKKIEEFKKNKFTEKSNEEVLAAEISRHIYKRHNVQEEWIPMDTHSDWDKYKKKPKKR